VELVDGMTRGGRTHFWGIILFIYFYLFLFLSSKKCNGPLALSHKKTATPHTTNSSSSANASTNPHTGQKCTYRMAGWHASTGRATNRENREQMKGHAISIQFANQRRRMHVSSSFTSKWSKRHDMYDRG
jgi:hypothetical protein